MVGFCVEFHGCVPLFGFVARFHGWILWLSFVLGFMPGFCVGFHDWFHGWVLWLGRVTDLGLQESLYHVLSWVGRCQVQMKRHCKYILP